MGKGLRIIKAVDLTGSELEDVTGITGEPTQCAIGEFFKLKRSDNQKYYISSTKVTSVETIDDSKRPEIKILQVKTRDKIYYLVTDAVYHLYNKE